MSSPTRDPLPCSEQSSNGEQSVSSPPQKRRQKADPCAGCEGKAMEGKHLGLNCLQKVAAPSSLKPTQSPEILAWIRKEVAQGISKAMEGSKRSVKRPRQRQVSSESSASEFQDPSEEFQVLNQVCSSEYKKRSFQNL
ncbi:Hypothetical predicted protein [Pelobates cultripes]|uniref:Uncharacterized protein n=1 Tax=Pelobates cultripes TaxID=61616 RepID=A0AAD1RF97_PELCU|nr:Hypothetical predicted protein [Pelobates cultripes]